MKTELRLKPHHLLPETAVVELWWDGVFIGEVVGADGPGVRVISKYRRSVSDSSSLVTEVAIDAGT